MNKKEEIGMNMKEKNIKSYCLHVDMIDLHKDNGRSK